MNNAIKFSIIGEPNSGKTAVALGVSSKLISLGINTAYVEEIGRKITDTYRLDYDMDYQHYMILSHIVNDMWFRNSIDYPRVILSDTSPLDYIAFADCTYNLLNIHFDTLYSCIRVLVREYMKKFDSLFLLNSNGIPKTTDKERDKSKDIGHLVRLKIIELIEEFDIKQKIITINNSDYNNRINTITDIIISKIKGK